MIGRIPGWAWDLVVAALFVIVAVVAERQTQGRIASSTIAMGVGIGAFLSLRVGATLARAGRTLGCGFVFGLTWLLPCATALFFTLDPRRRAVVRDSPTFFILLGLFVILVMVITFERVRVADVARFQRADDYRRAREGDDPMQSKARTVTAYFDEAPEHRQPALHSLRNLCLEILERYEEGMEYGMPGYKKDGVVEVSFASQRNYISLYLLKQPVMDAHRELLQGLSVGKGCIRYSRPEKMDFEVIETLLRASATSAAQVC